MDDGEVVAEGVGDTDVVDVAMRPDREAVVLNAGAGQRGQPRPRHRREARLGTPLIERSARPGQVHGQGDKHQRQDSVEHRPCQVPVTAFVDKPEDRPEKVLHADQEVDPGDELDDGGWFHEANTDNWFWLGTRVMFSGCA